MTTVAPAALLATRRVSMRLISRAHACYYAAQDAGCPVAGWYSDEAREAREVTRGMADAVASSQTAAAAQEGGVWRCCATCAPPRTAERIWLMTPPPPPRARRGGYAVLRRRRRAAAGRVQADAAVPRVLHAHAGAAAVQRWQRATDTRCAGGARRRLRCDMHHLDAAMLAAAPGAAGTGLSNDAFCVCAANRTAAAAYSAVGAWRRAGR